MNYSERFFYSLRVGSFSTARELLLENPELANTKDANSSCALHIVARLGELDFANLLLDRGAHLEAQTGETGSTPLKIAIFFAQIEMVKLLLVRGADPNNRGATSRSPLELAESATSPMFRDMGTPGSDLDYARIAKILRSKVKS